jgi:hypothetical protein
LQPWHRRVGDLGEPRSTVGSFPDVSGLSRRQRSLPAVHPHFCCRAVGVRPRVPSLVTVTLHLLGSGGESELLVGGSCGVPVSRVWDNSGRVRSFQVPTSKPVSPMNTVPVLMCRARIHVPSRADSARIETIGSIGERECLR